MKPVIFVEEIEELRVFEYLEGTSSESLSDVHKEPFHNLGMKQNENMLTL